MRIPDTHLNKLSGVHIYNPVDVDGNTIEDIAFISFVAGWKFSDFNDVFYSDNNPIVNAKAIVIDSSQDDGNNPLLGSLEMLGELKSALDHLKSLKESNHKLSKIILFGQQGMVATFTSGLSFMSRYVGKGSLLTASSMNEVLTILSSFMQEES